MVVAADPSVLRGIPEFFESEIGESLSARTESLVTFRELGPPDLWFLNFNQSHIVKSNPKGYQKEIGTYHYVLGALKLIVGTDTSTSASVAAYLNSLMYLLQC